MIKKFNEYNNTNALSVDVSLTPLKNTPKLVNIVKDFCISNPNLHNEIKTFMIDFKSQPESKNLKDVIKLQYKYFNDYPEVLKSFGKELINNNEVSLELDMLKTMLFGLNENHDENYFRGGENDPEVMKKKEYEDNKQKLLIFVLIVVVFIISLFFNDTNINVH